MKSGRAKSLTGATMADDLKQPSLFDDTDRGAALPTLGVPGSQAALSKEQKLFNRLIGKITAQRQLLQRWRDFEPVYRQRVVADFSPLNDRLREARIAMVGVLDAAMDHKALGKSHRTKVRDLLLGQLSELLGQARDEALVRLYDKHSDVSFDEEQKDEADFVQGLAKSLFGVEVDAEHGAVSPEDVAQRVAEKMATEHAERAERAQQAKKGRKKNSKAIAQESMREQAAQGASRALREVYRRLASELHPDRETDAEQRARKTALMQQANQAYAAADLLALLELQLSLEQIDADSLTGIAQDRLAHYNRVLEEQLERLQEELAEVTAPFVATLGGRVPRQFTPDQVRRALDDDVRELRGMLQSLEADLIGFQDINELKSRLRHYRVGIGDADEIDIVKSLLRAETGRARRR